MTTPSDLNYDQNSRTVSVSGNLAQSVIEVAEKEGVDPGEWIHREFARATDHNMAKRCESVLNEFMRLGGLDVRISDFFPDANLPKVLERVAEELYADLLGLWLQDLWFEGKIENWDPSLADHLPDSVQLYLEKIDGICASRQWEAAIGEKYSEVHCMGLECFEQSSNGQITDFLGKGKIPECARSAKPAPLS